MLKSVICSFKICFQNYGQLKRKFLRLKNTSSTFLKFELSSLSGPMLKTRKNTIRNQFEQQYSGLMLSAFRNQDVFIWYNLKPFAHKKGRFMLLYESRKFVKGQGAIITQINFKNHNIFASRNSILPNRTMPRSVCFIPWYRFPRYWN